MQTTVHEENKSRFDEGVAELLKHGWTIVPGTYSFQSSSTFIWNPQSQSHDAPGFTFRYFIVLEKD